MNDILSFIYMDLIQHPIIFSLAVIILVQVNSLKKEMRILYRDFCDHLKNHAKKEV